LLSRTLTWEDARYLQGALWVVRQMAGGDFESKALSRYMSGEEPGLADYMPHRGGEETE
jgi:hypothetical protein